MMNTPIESAAEETLSASSLGGLAGELDKSLEREKAFSIELQDSYECLKMLSEALRKQIAAVKLQKSAVQESIENEKAIQRRLESDLEREKQNNKQLEEKLTAEVSRCENLYANFDKEIESEKQLITALKASLDSSIQQRTESTEKLEKIQAKARQMHGAAPAPSRSWKRASELIGAQIGESHNSENNPYEHSVNSIPPPPPVPDSVPEVSLQAVQQMQPGYLEDSSVNFKIDEKVDENFKIEEDSKEENAKLDETEDAKEENLNAEENTRVADSSKSRHRPSILDITLPAPPELPPGLPQPIEVEEENDRHSKTLSISTTHKTSINIKVLKQDFALPPPPNLPPPN
jgi:myosin heavy subunit